VDPFIADFPFAAAHESLCVLALTARSRHCAIPAAGWQMSRPRLDIVQTALLTLNCSRALLLFRYVPRSIWHTGRALVFCDG
jgi:hypothetical protein